MTQVLEQSAKKDIKLHSRQWQIFRDKSRFKVLVAGRRFGKTILALTTLINSVGTKKSRCWYICPTYRQAKAIAWKMLLDMLPPEVITRKNEVELTLEFINGSELSLKGADNEDSLRGVGLDYVVLDEYAQMKANVWVEIIRPTLTESYGKAMFIGTPKGKNSLYELYLKGQRGDAGFKSWHYKSSDSPYIVSQEIEEARKILPDRYFKQEYEASFEDYVGLIYPEYNEKIHIITPHFVPQIYKRIGAIDPAMSGTTAVLKAYLDEDSNIIIYDEYYQPNVRVSEVANAIKGDEVTWYIDPASQSKTVLKEGKLYSLYNEYSDYGLHPRPAENDVEAGINRVGEAFKAGTIRIFSTCKNLLWELERYHWAEERETVAGIVKAKPYKKDDHLVDCLRYLIMSRYSKSDITYTVQPEYHSAEYFRLRKERQRVEANRYR